MYPEYGHHRRNLEGIPVFLFTRLLLIFSARSPVNSSAMSRSASLDSLILYAASITYPGKKHFQVHPHQIIQENDCCVCHWFTGKFYKSWQPVLKGYSQWHTGLSDSSLGTFEWMLFLKSFTGQVDGSIL